MRSTSIPTRRGAISLPTARGDINDLWRAGGDLQLASDDQYLREYKFDDEDILQNQLFAERFDDRDYFDAKVMGFQDLRVGSERSDQPNVPATHHPE